MIKNKTLIAYIRFFILPLEMGQISVLYEPTHAQDEVTHHFACFEENSTMLQWKNGERNRKAPHGHRAT
jgi:hypothetical protein